MKIGDRVKVVHYGHLLISYKEMPYQLMNKGVGMYRYDVLPDIVGKEGVIEAIDRDTGQFIIVGIDEKAAWYNESQLEMI